MGWLAVFRRDVKHVKVHRSYLLPMGSGLALRQIGDHEKIVGLQDLTPSALVRDKVNIGGGDA